MKKGGPLYEFIEIEGKERSVRWLRKLANIDMKDGKQNEKNCKILPYLELYIKCHPNKMKNHSMFHHAFDVDRTKLCRARKLKANTEESVDINSSHGTQISLNQPQSILKRKRPPPPHHGTPVTPFTQQTGAMDVKNFSGGRRVTFSTQLSLLPPCTNTAKRLKFSQVQRTPKQFANVKNNIYDHLSEKTTMDSATKSHVVDRVKDVYKLRTQ